MTHKSRLASKIRSMVLSGKRLLPSRSHENRRICEKLFWFVLLAAMAWATLAQSRFDLISLPFLSTTAFMAVVAGLLVAHHRQIDFNMVKRESRARSAETHLRRSEQLHRLLSENASDVISRFDLEGNRLYVSPSVQEVLGWTPEQMSDATWKQRVHPDDIAAFTTAGNRMRDGDERIDVIYRYRRPDNSWTWIEARLRLVRDAQGEPAEFISNARDISQQKRTEQALARAINELSVLATTDGLTGLANRRRFDESLRKEWRRAMRSGSAVSLLMIDVDHFKPYNDLYGHRQGDACLRVIASIMSALARRPGDLCARYGGEEFALILPNTDAAGACDLGERVLATVAALKREHAHAPAGFVTISIGAATITPTRHSTSNALVENADAALYGAKHAGRNRLMSFAAMSLNPRPNQQVTKAFDTDPPALPLIHRLNG